MSGRTRCQTLLSANWLGTGEFVSGVNQTTSVTWMVPSICTRLVLKFIVHMGQNPYEHKPFATVAQCIMNSFHGGQVFASEP